MDDYRVDTVQLQMDHVQGASLIMLDIVGCLQPPLCCQKSTDIGIEADRERYFDGNCVQVCDHSRSLSAGKGYLLQQFWHIPTHVPPCLEENASPSSFGLDRFCVMDGVCRRVHF